MSFFPVDIKHKIVYIIAGKGEQEREVKKLTTKYGLDKQVVFLGYSEDIPSLINAADIILSTSYREGLPKNVMEAMASEKPVIGTDVRGNKDLIKHGETGLLIPVGDYKATAEAITKLISDKELCITVEKAAKEYAEQYSLGNVLNKMADIYNERLGR
jgi:glycosyltransferase involved in cell wall biosynthesis